MQQSCWSISFLYPVFEVSDRRKRGGIEPLLVSVTGAENGWEVVGSYSIGDVSTIVNYIYHVY